MPSDAKFPRRHILIGIRYQAQVRGALGGAIALGLTIVASIIVRPYVRGCIRVLIDIKADPLVVGKIGTQFPATVSNRLRKEVDS